MATKRKRTRESNKANQPATDAAKPEASGRIAPRKRTDAPVKAAKAKPLGAKAASKKAATATHPSAKSTRVASSKPTGRSGSTRSVPRTDEAEASSVDGSRGRRARREASTKPPRKRWPFVVVGMLLAVVLLVVGGFSWDRWLRYDDASEFQGSWQTHGTTAVVVIDGQSIKLTEDVTWTYTLDTDAKTIAFTFGNMEGSGRYRFSLDRSQLVITDGSGYTWFSTLADDIAWQFDQLMRTIQGQPQEEPPSGDHATVLDRLSNDASATPQTGTPVKTESESAEQPGAKEEATAGTTAESEGFAGNAPQPGSGAASDAASGTAGGNADANASGSASADDAEANANASDAVDGGGAGSSGSTIDVFDVSDLPA